MDLQKINDVPKIPRFRTNCWEDLEIEGQTVRVHKPRARAATVVATRAAETFGETVLAIVASPPTDEDGRTLAELIRAGQIGAETLKTVITSGLIGVVAERMRDQGKDVGAEHLYWYIDTLLANCVEYEGHRFATVDDLSDAGFGMQEIVRMFYSAIVMAIYPTSGGRGTSAGKPQSPMQTLKASQPSPQKRKSKGKGAIDKAGQSVRTRGKTG